MNSNSNSKNYQTKKKNKNKNSIKSSSSSSSSSSASTSWGARVHTLNTIDAYSSTSTSSLSSSLPSSSTSLPSSSSSSSTFKIQHIPNLPSSEYAASILQRIQNEFQLLVQKRGYNLTSVTEMCCCDDGFNYLGTNNGNNITGTSAKKKKGSKKRGRKTRLMPNNVLGYNLTQGYRPRRNNTKHKNNTTSSSSSLSSSQLSSSTHRIHLRLRNPKNHSTFYPYEDIAGTMCHELAHCERGPHDALFYKLMDDIMEQYSIFLVRGLVVGKDGFPVGNDGAFRLGGGGGSNVNGNGIGIGGSNGFGKHLVAGVAAQQRLVQQQKKMNGVGGGTYVLGGGLSYIQDVKQKETNQKKHGFNIYGNGSSSSSSSRSRSSSSSSKSALVKLPPREAARIAAEQRIEERRINDSKFCLPCQEIIEILDESSCDEEEDQEEDFHGDVVDVVDDVDGDDDVVVVDCDQDNRNVHDEELKKKNASIQRNHVKKTGQPSNVKTQGNNNIHVIDLIDDDSSIDDNDNNGEIIHHDVKQQPNPTLPNIPSLANNDDGLQLPLPNDKWFCTSCTFANSNISLSCEVCGTTKKNKNHTPNNNNIKNNNNNNRDNIPSKFKNNVNDNNGNTSSTPSHNTARTHSSTWSCTKCTYAENMELSLSCEICGVERGGYAKKSEKLIQEMIRNDFIDNVKKKEKEQSKKEFNGFNIYGNEKRSSSTMNHLT